MIFLKITFSRNNSRILTAAVVVLLNENIALVQFDEITSVAADSHMSVLYIAMQTLRCFFTGCDCIDGKLRTGEHIAADEDVGLGRLVGQFVSNRINTTDELHLGIFQQVFQYHRLTDSKDHKICLQRKSLVLVERRCKLMFCIEDRGTTLEGYTGDLCTLYFVPLYFLRSPSRIDHYAVFARFHALFERCRHDVFGLQREHRHFRCTAAFSYTCSVDGYVSAADNHYAFANAVDDCVLVTLCW